MTCEEKNSNSLNAIQLNFHFTELTGHSEHYFQS